jgi:glycosyltransferase involved in cell wall biosynthesis
MKIRSEGAVAAQRSLIFVSSMNGDPRSGSEELWSRTAREIASQDIPVSVSVLKSSAFHPRIADLKARGVDLWVHQNWYSLPAHPWRWLAQRRYGASAYDLARLISARSAALVVLSDGGGLPPIELLELCTAKRLPFVTIGQSNSESFWPTDTIAERFRRVLPKALRCYFVSEANLRLAEKQVGMRIPNSEVVWNPVNLHRDAPIAWPSLSDDSELRFACVGRLLISHKGQDILLEALAAPSWKTRRWRLSFYGEGPMREGLELLAQRLGISDRVEFPGFAPVEQIWASHHVLVMPSRYEGMPLAVVEAMLCARPVVGTDVGGHPEIITDGVTGFLADAPTARSMTAALERLWSRRNEAENIGKAGARKIRELVPSDPIHIFSEKLKQLAGISEQVAKAGQ